MQDLERYLIDCENKRRRMRDRPSDAVLAELRALLERMEAREEERSHDAGDARLKESA